MPMVVVCPLYAQFLSQKNGHKSSDFLMMSLEELNDIVHSEESIVHSELDDIVLT